MTQVLHTQSGRLLNDGLDNLFTSSREVRDDFGAYLDEIYLPTSAQKRSDVSNRSGTVDRNYSVEEDQTVPVENAKNGRDRTSVVGDRPDADGPTLNQTESATSETPPSDEPAEIEGENPTPAPAKGTPDTLGENTEHLGQASIAMDKMILSALETPSNSTAPVRPPLTINQNITAPLESLSRQAQLQTTLETGGPGPQQQPLENMPENLYENLKRSLPQSDAKTSSIIQEQVVQAANEATPKTIDNRKMAGQLTIRPDDGIEQKTRLSDALKSIETASAGAELQTDIHPQSLLNNDQENDGHTESRSRSRQIPEDEEPAVVEKPTPAPLNEVQKGAQTSGVTVQIDPRKPIAFEKSNGLVEILAVDNTPAPNASRDDENTERIIKAARAVISRGTSRIQIRLEPPELGALRINIKQGSTGLQLQLQATNARAHQMLEQNVVQLRAALESQGLGSVQIDIQLRLDLRNDSTPDQPSNSPQDQQHASQSRQEQRQEFRSTFEDRQIGPDPTGDSEEQEVELPANHADQEIGSGPASLNRWHETEFVSLDLTV